MPTKSLTTQQAAAQITRYGESWSGDLQQPATITYGFLPSSGGDFAFSERQIALAEECMQLWADAANIKFERVDAANADIAFVNFNDPGGKADGFQSGSVSDQVRVNINLAYSGERLEPEWVSSVSLIGGSELGPLPDHDKATMLHEIGHALGLAHPGNYDASDAERPTYADDALYVQDTKQFSLMSYFSESNTGSNYGGMEPLTPQLHDLAAIQRLYGFNMSTRTGDTIYGFNSNTGSSSYTIEHDYDPVVFTIWDAGGIDTVDFSNYGVDATIDLTPGQFSSVGGLTNNIAISQHVLIENAKGGFGDDSIIGNWANNSLYGGAGNDVIDGKAGADYMNGGADNDTYMVDDASDVVSERVVQSGVRSRATFSDAGGNDTVRTTLSTYTLQTFLENVKYEGVGAFTGYGNSVDNQMTGYTGNDSLFGYAGSDLLDGRGGADFMAGGAGDDVYVVDNVGDVTSERETTTILGQLYVTDAGGTDEIRTTLSRYALNAPDMVENLTYIGAGSFEGVGTETANTIVGGGVGVNTLRGLGGNDILQGGNGDNYLYGDGGDDIIRLANGTTALGRAQVVDGGEDSDTLDFGKFGRVAIDLETGKLQMGSADGLSTSYSEHVEIRSIENVTGTAQDDEIAGNAGDNVLLGLSGDDRLEGRGGNDVVDGGVGNDTIVMRGAIGDLGLDKIDGGADFDTLDFSGFEGHISLNLGAGTLGMVGELGAASLAGIRNVESAVGTASADVISGDANDNSLKGGDGDDVMAGGEGDDELDGGSGADAMTGGNGDDNYMVDNAGDQVIEQEGGGRDTVVAALDEYTLADNVEMLLSSTLYMGKENFHGTGNSIGNTIYSGGGDDILEGGAGNDFIWSDKAFFGTKPEGRDTLIGGADDDYLVGGGGADLFVLRDGDGHDTIADFDEAEGDQIDFSGVTGVTGFSNLAVTSGTFGDAVVSFGDLSVTLEGVDVASLNGSEMIFAPSGAANAVVPDAAMMLPIGTPAEPVEEPATQLENLAAPEDPLVTDDDGLVIAEAPAALPVEDAVSPAAAEPEVATADDVAQNNLSEQVAELADRASDLGILDGTIDLTRLQDLSGLVLDAVAIAKAAAEVLDIELPSGDSFDIGQIDDYFDAAVDILSAVDSGFDPIAALRAHFL